MTINTIINICVHTLNIGSSWAEKYAKELAWGLDSVGCLGFLHGKKGVSRGGEDCPPWMLWTWEAWCVDRGIKIPYDQVSVEWSNGTISWPENGRTRQMKLGKWLRKAKAGEKKIKKFETRLMSEWHWQISADPWDILTMSHNRAWTSCMRPDGAYENGLFSDMRGGSAILFWFRPGASQPCGREILRPAVDNNGKNLIIRGGTLYGSGPQVGDEELSSICGVEVCAVELERLTSLCRDVYCDSTRRGCYQTDEELVAAEERLLYGWRNYLLQGAEIYPKVIEEAPVKKKTPARHWRNSWNPHGGRRNVVVHLNNGLRELHSWEADWDSI